MKAFPSEQKCINPLTNDLMTIKHTGMDLRDYFAAKIAPQMNWEGTYAKDWEKLSSDKLRAKRIYEIADAMMEARKNEKN